MNILEKRSSTDLTNEVQKHFERLTSISSISEVDTETEAHQSQVVANINPHLYSLEEDFLYHISLGKNVDDLADAFKVNLILNQMLRNVYLFVLNIYLRMSGLFAWVEVLKGCINLLCTFKKLSDIGFQQVKHSKI